MWLRDADLVVLSDCRDDTPVGSERWAVYENTGSGFADTPIEWAAPVALAPDGWRHLSQDWCDRRARDLFRLADLDGDRAPELVRFAFVLGASAVVSTALQLCRRENRMRLFEERARRHATEERLSEANERLEELSRRDPLTNLLNRRGIFDRLGVELDRVKRGHPLAALLIDLDGFKDVNDRYGHLEGDRLLQAIAESLLRATRSGDAVGRYGGDEFLVLLTDTRLDDATATAERLVERVRKVGVQLPCDFRP